jgi:hypothetical protein
MADMIDVETVELEEKEYSLSGGDFFNKNPQKLLAEPYEGSGRFGPVTKYRPKEGLSPIDALKEIEAPIFIGHGITDLSAGMSVVKTDIREVPMSISEEDNISKAIENTEKDIIKRERSVKRTLQDFDEPAAKPTIQFEDILRNYNPELSMDEIRAFLWYMHGQGNTYRGKWLNVFNPQLLSQEQESAYINAWVKSGILFYYKSELLPAFIYFSEELYERKEQLNRDKDDIIRIYGEDAYNVQETKLSEAFSELYNNRLKLDDPEPDRRLHLKPYGEFTKSITVKNWNIDNTTGEIKPFLVVLSVSGDINWYSAKTSLSEWRDRKVDELSIADAFRFWLKHDNNRPSLPYNFNWEHIFKYYIDKKSVKNIDPTVLARNRALAKEVGDKMFSKFLAEVILENDRVKIERIWNDRYNGSRGLRTEKVPIAFECALNYPGDEPVEIKPEKREAVAFASIRGSSLNAYQVGVGKTWAAIFTFAQFLDCGHCKRILLTVPNQVYKQFYSEIRGLLPNRKIYDLYNLSAEYIEKLQDENGNIQKVEEGSITIITYEGFERIGFQEQTATYLLEQLKTAITQIQEDWRKNKTKT